MSQAQPRAKRVQGAKSEFLGLHDPYAQPSDEAGAQRAHAEPLITREKMGELGRATATLVVIMLVMAAAAMAFH